MGRRPERRKARGENMIVKLSFIYRKILTDPRNGFLEFVIVCL